jgi:hypothetical protein
MPESRFEGSGPVARYWLANCEGFVVRGDARGVVVELIRDANPHVTTRLVVRTRTGRRKVIPTRAVESVDPSARVLVVEDRRARRVRSHARTRAATTRAARSSRAATARAGMAWSWMRRHAPREAERVRIASARAGAPVVHALAGSLRLLLAEVRSTSALLRAEIRTASRSRHRIAPWFRKRRSTRRIRGSSRPGRAGSS